MKILNDNQNILLKEKEKYYQNENFELFFFIINWIIKKKKYLNYFWKYFYKKDYKNLIIFRFYKILKLLNKWIYIIYNIEFIFIYNYNCTNIIIYIQ